MQPLSVDAGQRRGLGRGASRSSCHSFGLGVLVGGLACAGLAAVASLHAPAPGSDRAAKFLQGQLPPRFHRGAAGRHSGPLRAQPEAARGYHRFVAADDPTFEGPVGGLTYKPRERFLGTRREGAYNGSFRVYFTLPGRADAPKAIEFLPLSTGTPEFGAVTVEMSLGAVVQSLPPENFMQVQEVEAGSHADTSGLKVGDIIRAVSLPDDGWLRDGTAWRQFARSFREATGVPVPLGQLPPPRPEEGLAVLDGLYFADLYAALMENKEVRGRNCDVVFIVERPSSIPDYLRKPASA